MLLAGDVGGTKTLVGLFDRARHRPTPVLVRSYPTQEFTSFAGILTHFILEVAPPVFAERFGRHAPVDVEAAAFGVAGPVVGGRARLPNVGWDVALDDIAACTRSTTVRLLNDVEAMAAGVEHLAPGEYVRLQPGEPRADGNAAILAAGTGLGQASLLRVNGRLRALASEGGHADFAARTDRELALVRMLREQYGRVEVEQVISGPGLVNLHRFTHEGGRCAVAEGDDAAMTPALVSQAGLSGRCQGCAEALQMFVSAYGAEAGNLALRSVATSGLYVAGGIAPRILPALQSGLFLQAFLAKAPMTDLLARIPVTVILNEESALVGAAISAQDL